MYSWAYVISSSGPISPVSEITYMLLVVSSYRPATWLVSISMYRSRRESPWGISSSALSSVSVPLMSASGLSRLNEPWMNLPSSSRLNTARLTGVVSVRPRSAETWRSISS